MIDLNRQGDDYDVMMSSSEFEMEKKWSYEEGYWRGFLIGCIINSIVVMLLGFAFGWTFPKM